MVKWLFFLTGWGTALMLTSCNAYLDVEPKDRYLETSVFTDSTTTELARQGIYTQLATDALYGGTLTLGALDVMAQYYRYDEGHVMQGFGRYSYSDTYVTRTFTQAWETAYNTLLNINSFIVGVKNAQGIFSEASRQCYLGEAYGLRAYLHFDLLRLFGPVYREAPEGTAIPYYTAPSAKVQPLLTAREVGRRVLADLDSAYQCFSAPSVVTLEQPVDRFNRLAVLATYARVYLYLGDTEQAAVFANNALEESQEGVGWDTDRLFSDEVILRLPVVDMVRQYNRYFNPELPLTSLLSPPIAVLAETYGGNTQDLRYQQHWSYFPKEGMRINAFVKYATPASFVPLIRLSELYFIQAECATDQIRGTAYLQEVAEHRGEELMPDVAVADALPGAYRREFWGEGQLFYFYKRVFQRMIPDGNAESQGVSMDARDYQVPLPAEEGRYR